MSDENEIKLGSIIPPSTEVLRDATHIALAPMVAGERLTPGCKVRLKAGTSDVAIAGEYNHPIMGKLYAPDHVIGVADPFISTWMIAEGERFWCFLWPKSVTGMRHHWSHPAFKAMNIIPDEPMPPITESEAWLQGFAQKYNINYKNMIEDVTEKEGYIHASGQDLHSKDDLDDGEWEALWSNIEALKRMKFSEEHKESTGFSCSC